MHSYEQAILRTGSEIRWHPHVSPERAHLFRCYDGESMEVEYLELMNALVRCSKPERVLVTGAAAGHEAVTIAGALHENGLGSLLCVERHADRADRLRRYLEELGLHNAEVRTVEPESFLGTCSERFAMVLLDSVLGRRARELEVCVQRHLLEPGALVCVHDTSRLRATVRGDPDPETAMFWADMRRLRREGLVGEAVEFPLSRGLLLYQVGAGSQ
jgi:predicted O-methyltransferase YrrM